MWALLRDRKFTHATAVLIGTMVGVGIYGIPFAFSKAGFLVGTAWLLGVAVIITLFSLMFAELTLSTQGVHQVSGYANIWLGAWGRRAATFANVLSMYGVLLAYMVVVGEFLHNILSHFIAVDPQLYSLAFALVCSLVWGLRTRTIAAIEQAFIVLYTGLILVVAALCVGHVHWANYAGWTPHFWYLPYGVVLFSLSGLSAIPIQRQLLAGRERLLKYSVIAAILFVVAMYLLFAFVIVGVSGSFTSPEAFAGLYGLVGAPVIIIGSLLGILTITTSYVGLGTALYEMLHVDYRQPAMVSWLLTLLPPAVFFLSGLRNFIDIIGLVGSVASGLLGIVLLAAYLRSRRMRLRTPELRLRVPAIVVWLIMLVFAAGIAYELFLR